MIEVSETRTSQPVPPTPGGLDRRSVTWWWIATIFVVAVLVAALAVILLGPNEGPAAGSPPATTEAPAVCDPAPGPQDVPGTTPAGIEWRVSPAKVVLPYSKTAGPLIEAGPIARCYSQDPVGAVLAASQIYARFLAPNRQEGAQIAQEQMVPGPERDRLLESLSTPTDSPEQIQWRAFRYLSYTSDQAVVVMALESNAGSGVVGIPMTLEWRDEDWKWNYDAYTPGYPLSEADLSTYVQWSGIR